MSFKLIPQSRKNDLVVQEAGNELLVYDLVTNKAYCLNETLALVYRHCDGETTFDELKTNYRFTDDLIYLALDTLQKEQLIEEYRRQFTNVSRRQVIRKIGLTSILALPVMTSLMAPRAVHAQSVACVNPGGFPAGDLTLGFGNEVSESASQQAALNNANNLCCSGMSSRSAVSCDFINALNVCSYAGICQ